MNATGLLVAAGIVAGGIVGWFTAPAPSTVDVGPLHIQAAGGDSGNGSTTTVTTGDNGINVNVSSNSPLDNRGERTAIFAVIGAVVGGVAAYANNRTRKV
jgi:hypothetical protein